MTRAPMLRALMCDGMGWFQPTDIKRALLLFDQVEYLLPSDTVEFEDETGRRRMMLFPGNLNERSLVPVRHYKPTEAARRQIADASRADADDPGFVDSFNRIPMAERTYTWRVVNADADLGDGRSAGLPPSQDRMAHAMLLNKFLLAADELQAVPITGKSYIYPLIGAKYEAARRAFAPLVQSSGGRLPTALASKLQPVAMSIAGHFVADEYLAQRSIEDILQYKERHRDLFERFTLEIVQLASTIDAHSGTPEFDEQMQRAILVELNQRRFKVEEEMRSAWNGLFKTSAKAATGAVLGLGVTPFFPLSALVASAAAASAAWLVPELVERWGSFRKISDHGLYYLMKFGQ